jgi:hypothetical protein
MRLLPGGHGKAYVQALANGESKLVEDVLECIRLSRRQIILRILVRWRTR